jgi:hypothetical protein
LETIKLYHMAPYSHMGSMKRGTPKVSSSDLGFLKVSLCIPGGYMVFAYKNNREQKLKDES